MIYIVLSICCSLSISILMKRRRDFVNNEMAMFMANYVICTLLSKYYTGAIAFNADTKFGFYLGMVSGALYLIAFVLSDKNVAKNGMVMSNIFGKLGVLVPSAMSILIFGETLKAHQWVGFFLAILAIFLIYFDKSGLSAVTSAGLLILYMLTSGITDSTISIYDKMGVATYKDQFLLFNFFFAFVCSAATVIYRRQKIGKMDLLWGVLIGVPNYFSARFMMLALETVPAILTYPMISIGSITCITLTGTLLFKENLSKRKIVALAVVAVALVLLNL